MSSRRNNRRSKILGSGTGSGSQTECIVVPVEGRDLSGNFFEDVEGRLKEKGGGARTEIGDVVVSRSGSGSI